MDIDLSIQKINERLKAELKNTLPDNLTETQKLEKLNTLINEIGIEELKQVFLGRAKKFLVSSTTIRQSEQDTLFN